MNKIDRKQADLEIGMADESIRQLRMKEFEKMLESKFGVKHGVQELLGNYIMLERYFLSESVSKAIAMDSPIDGSLTSSVVDDVFFLVKKSIRFFEKNEILSAFSFKILKILQFSMD